MARDVVVLLDYIGWKEERGVHVVGISLGALLPGYRVFLVFTRYELGGMIAQGLSSRLHTIGIPRSGLLLYPQNCRR